MNYVGSVSKSTEETLTKIEGYTEKRNNIKKENDEIVVVLMDMWYPRAIPNPIAKGIRTMVEESNIIFKGIT